MKEFPVFLTVVLVMRNLSDRLDCILENATELLMPLVKDYELVIVDNASEDGSVARLKKFTSQDGLPNLQVYALTKEVDADTASWVGLENALGDFVAVIDPLSDDLGFLPNMLEEATSGSDVVFANNERRHRQGAAYGVANITFHWLYKKINGIDLAKEAPQYRILSRNVINFILRHPQPSITYRHLPATGGFARSNMEYSAAPLAINNKRLRDSMDRGMRLLVSTTRVPMRLVTILSLIGAGGNIIYSLYILAIVFIKDNVAPGWASMSLQISSMFFLISLVLLVLGEYILNMASLSNEGPLYHVGQEFTSVRMTKRERLNIEEDKTNSARELELDTGYE